MSSSLINFFGKPYPKERNGVMIEVDKISQRKFVRRTKFLAEIQDNLIAIRFSNDEANNPTRLEKIKTLTYKADLINRQLGIRPRN